MLSCAGESDYYTNIVSFNVLKIIKLIIATELKVVLLVMPSLIILAFVRNHDAIPAAVLQLN